MLTSFFSVPERAAFDHHLTLMIDLAPRPRALRILCVEEDDLERRLLQACMDAIQAEASLRMLLDLCIARDYWLAPQHFMPPHLCKVRMEGWAYRMVWWGD